MSAAARIENATRIMTPRRSHSRGALIGWVRSGLAPEGNHLMAAFLDAGNLPFLAAKLGMGTVCCAVLIYGSEYKLAKVGVSIALVVYTCVMGLHVGTGLAAYGFLS
jgi:hypothetical protein